MNRDSNNNVLIYIGFIFSLICLTGHQVNQFYDETISFLNNSTSNSENNSSGLQVFPPLNEQCPALYPSPSQFIEFPEPSSCGRGVRAGTRCHMGCIPGYELIGSCSRVCLESGQWTGSESMCVNQRIMCPQLPFQRLISTEDYEYEEVYLEMNSSQTLSSKQFILQQQGIPARPIDPLSCINFGGGICRFYCEPGTVARTSLALVCLQNGQWSGAVPTCYSSGISPIPTSPTQFPTQYPTRYPTQFPTQYPYPYQYPTQYPTQFPGWPTQ